jgi:hypothetical protein
MHESSLIPEANVPDVKDAGTFASERAKLRLRFLVDADIAYREGNQEEIQAIVDRARACGIDLLKTKEEDNGITTPELRDNP